MNDDPDFFDTSPWIDALCDWLVGALAGSIVAWVVIALRVLA